MDDKDMKLSEEKKKLQEEFLKTVDSKLRKEEYKIWMVKDLDHLDKN